MSSLGWLWLYSFFFFFFFVLFIFSYFNFCVMVYDGNKVVSIKSEGFKFFW